MIVPDDAKMWKKTIFAFLLCTSAFMVIMHTPCFLCSNTCSAALMPKNVISDRKLGFILENPAFSMTMNKQRNHVETMSVIRPLQNPNRVSDVISGYEKFEKYVSDAMLGHDKYKNYVSDVMPIGNPIRVYPYHSKVPDMESISLANPGLQKLWTSKNWRLKVSVFLDIFNEFVKHDMLKPCSKALCIGAGQGQEVLALKELGVVNSVGIDLIASPPLVMKGDLHSQPFGSHTFDFEFSNVFDHALFTPAFVAEVDRTLKPGGYLAIHLMMKRKVQNNNNIHQLSVLFDLFRSFDVVCVREIDSFGLDTEVVFRKPLAPKKLGLMK